MDEKKFRCAGWKQQPSSILPSPWAPTGFTYSQANVLKCPTSNPVHAFLVQQCQNNNGLLSEVLTDLQTIHQTKPSYYLTRAYICLLIKNKGGWGWEESWYGDAPSTASQALAPQAEELLDTTLGSLRQGRVPRSPLLAYVSALGLSQRLACSWLQKSYSPHFNSCCCHSSVERKDLRVFWF